MVVLKSVGPELIKEPVGDVLDAVLIQGDLGVEPAKEAVSTDLLVAPLLLDARGGRSHLSETLASFPLDWDRGHSLQAALLNLKLPKELLVVKVRVRLKLLRMRRKKRKEKQDTGMPTEPLGWWWW